MGVCLPTGDSTLPRTRTSISGVLRTRVSTGDAVELLILLRGGASTSIASPLVVASCCDEPTGAAALAPSCGGPPFKTPVTCLMFKTNR